MRVGGARRDLNAKQKGPSRGATGLPDLKRVRSSADYRPRPMVRCCAWLPRAGATPRDCAPALAELETPFSTGVAAIRATWIIRAMPAPWCATCERPVNVCAAPSGATCEGAMPAQRAVMATAPATTALMVITCLVVSPLPGTPGNSTEQDPGRGREQERQRPERSLRSRHPVPWFCLRR